jgi:hypothetical protein
MDSAATLMGNPFSEPQGLNSVFSTDKSTLTVIAGYLLIASLLHLPSLYLLQHSAAKFVAA